MTYHGDVLLMSGYQADELRIVQQYRAVIDNVESRYPTGVLWILNRAKILRMTYDPEGAIEALKRGLDPGRPHSFAQADTMVRLMLLISHISSCLSLDGHCLDKGSIKRLRKRS